MKSNPTRAGPSLYGNLHSNLERGYVAGTQRGHNLREPVRWASEPVEGCYPKATGSEAHRTGQFTFG